MLQNLKLFDAHFHIIDNRFPLVSNLGYLPETFTCSNYLTRMNKYSLNGGVIVSGSFQAFDQTYLMDALETLGPSFVGVTQLPKTISDEELLKLNNAGVRAVRFNLKRNNSVSNHYIESTAKRIYEIVGWHTELYVDSKELTYYYQMLLNLPAVSIDHLGLSHAGFSTLIKLAEHGVRVKATGFGRLDFDAKDAICDLYSVNPHSLMFGTDLPSTRANRPYRDDDFCLVIDSLSPEQAHNVIYKNAIDFYNPKQRNI